MKIKKFQFAKNLRFLRRNKKGIFGMMHPGLMFFIGLILGIALGYFLSMYGLFPVKGLS